MPSSGESAAAAPGRVRHQLRVGVDVAGLDAVREHGAGPVEDRAARREAGSRCAGGRPAPRRRTPASRRPAATTRRMPMTANRASARNAPSRSAAARVGRGVGGRARLARAAAGRRGVGRGAVAGRGGGPPPRAAPPCAGRPRPRAGARRSCAGRAVVWRGPASRPPASPPSTTRNVGAAPAPPVRSDVRRARRAARPGAVRPRGVYACASKIPPRPRTGPAPVAPPRAGARRGVGRGWSAACVTRSTAGAPRRVAFGSRRGSGARGGTATAPRPAR